jgi:hypothetical protein
VAVYPQLSSATLSRNNSAKTVLSQNAMTLRIKRHCCIAFRT